MTLSADIIKEIGKLVQQIRDENDIKNEIIRDDVFSILQAQDCTVLYYPLENEVPDGQGNPDGVGCDGCHIEKPVCGKQEQFVFINTNNTRERQAFSVAHELGHIWRVDQRLHELIPDKQIEDESVINRFAAELLMPESLFDEKINQWLSKEGYTGPSIKITDMVRLVAYLMNEFFVPFKAVIYRFNETGRLKVESNDMIMEYKDSPLLNEIIKAEQYTRLNIVNKARSMDNLPEYLQLAEKRNIINPKKLNEIRSDFEIIQVEEPLDNDVLFAL